MRATTISVLSALSAIALAQDLSGLPTCAQTAALQGASSSGCTLTDAECFCKNTGFISSLKTAISSACTSAADQQAACAWGNSACSIYGVTIDCGTTTADPTTVDAAAADAGSTTMAPTDAGAVTVAATDAAGSVVSTTSMSMSTPTDGSMDSMLSSSMVSSVSTIPSGSMSSMMSTMMNSTHAASNMTHAPTMMASSTSAGPTSPYTGAGNTAARQGGVVGAVLGVALLFALF